jgi:hypothetical protein
MGRLHLFSLQQLLDRRYLTHNIHTPHAAPSNPQVPVFFGISVGIGLSVAVSNFDASNTVAVSMLASKLQQPPLSMPEVVPTLSQPSMDYLLANGPSAFFALYGTHFIVGFQMGGSLLMSYSLQSNEMASKSDISATLRAKWAFITVEASGGFKESKYGKQVNIAKSVKTNTNLPFEECARAAVGDTWNADVAQICLRAWMDLPGYAAYNAYAIPYEFHPQFQEAMEQRAGRRRARRLLQSAGASAPAPIPDYKFKETGLLQMRLNAITNSLDKYQFKEDMFFYRAVKAVEVAQAQIDATLSLLRNQTTTSIEQWRPPYLKAAGLVELASERASNVPKGELALGVEAAGLGAAGCLIKCDLRLDQTTENSPINHQPLTTNNRREVRLVQEAVVGGPERGLLHQLHQLVAVLGQLPWIARQAVLALRLCLHLDCRLFWQLAAGGE